VFGSRRRDLFQQLATAQDFDGDKIIVNRACSLTLPFFIPSDAFKMAWAAMMIVPGADVAWMGWNIYCEIVCMCMVLRVDCVHHHIICILNLKW